MILRVLVLIALLPGSALAAGEADPDWPCIQRRQPQLSLGQVWAGPQPDDAITALAAEPEIQRVASVLALRRTSPEEAAALVETFVAGGSDPARLTALYLATFNHIQRTRDRVMAGITRYAHKQAGLDEQIKARRHEFEQLSAADSPDFDAIDKAEQDIDWSTRIFQDRQRALTYVCETPVILEQRAFAIGRLISGKLQ
ncbi:hypothetical protein [Gemmobacter sp. 24YEA27]|uniref:hypothetical protein n=1 Tax=Gemmobacter sp. 24YEA27 TaxID=3040672 RepID=UPI0024B33BCF|nr:hypothetical protein [Gemmobacter sp. 24YEA27]